MHLVKVVLIRTNILYSRILYERFLISFGAINLVSCAQKKCYIRKATNQYKSDVAESFVSSSSSSFEPRGSVGQKSMNILLYVYEIQNDKYVVANNLLAYA